MRQHGIGWARDRKSVVRTYSGEPEPAELCFAPSAQGLRVWREKVKDNKEELVTQYNGILKMPALLS